MGACVVKQSSSQKKDAKSIKQKARNSLGLKRRKRTDSEHGPSGDDDFDINSKKQQQAKSKEFQKKKLEKLFEHYKQSLLQGSVDDEPVKEHISQEGLAQFCKDLGIDTEDSVVLVMAYLFKIEDISLGFTREEFINGFEKYKLDTIEKIKNYLPTFRKELEDTKTESFKEIHRWGFDFAKTEKTHRTVDRESVLVMLSLIWQNKNYHINNFVEYLKNSRG